MRKAMILVGLALLALSACATMQKPEVRTPEREPAISKTIGQKPSDGRHRFLKRKVAIARFTNETVYGQSFFVDENKDRIGKQAVDILSNKLLATEKFILLERADLEKISKELALGKVDQLLNMADYLIVGSVTEFGRKTTSDVGIFSRVKKQVAYAKVNIRLIDVYTGEIIYSQDGTGEAFSEAGSIMGVGSKADYDSTLNDKALEAAITNLSSNIIESLLDKPWRSYILAYEDGRYIISGGASQGVKPGDTFSVYMQGKKIKNPQTNMFVALPGRRVAVIKVLQTLGDSKHNEISVCEVMEGRLEKSGEKGAFALLYIQDRKE